jgi:hypothetical protein
MPITGGSAMEFETKRQRNNYFRSVNTIINDGPAARPEWAKVPITFTEEDFRLKSTNHNDAMFIEVNIAGWIIGKILVDNGSSAYILFLKTSKKMNLSQHMLHPPEYPLLGFGGKPIKPMGKIPLPVSFGDLDNARTEKLTFDVVDMYHPVVWTSLGPLPRWVPGPTTRWAPGTTRLVHTAPDGVRRKDYSGEVLG